MSALPPRLFPLALGLLTALGAPAASLRAQPSAPPPATSSPAEVSREGDGPQEAVSRKAVAGMTQAAAALLAALDESQRAGTVYPLTDAERENWKFVPASRNGLSLSRLRPEQTPLVYALLGTALSADGLRKSASIISLEQVLHELENQSPTRDPGQYFLTIFGEPKTGAAWGWRFEGHHLALNFAISGSSAVSLTPTFMGANPGQITGGPRAGLRVLAAEEDLAFALARSLTPEQRRIAILPGDVPSDILSGQKREVRPLLPAGLPAREMTGTQRRQLWELIAEYVDRFRPDLTTAARASLQRDGDGGSLTFAWSGAMEPGSGHYYRIQSTEFLFEYDNTQNNARHPHTVWRDFGGDFGRDLLREHYLQNHAPK